MSERCVFANNSTGDFRIPYKGEHGECLAQEGEEMNTCCYQTAYHLILLGQKELVEQIMLRIAGDSWSSRSKRKGIHGALHKHTSL